MASDHRRVFLGTFLCTLLVSAAAAQQSASFKLEEHAFNAGGHPEAGTTMASGGLRVTLDAIAGAPAARLSSDSFYLDGGFCNGFPPPGEVEQLLFTDAQTLVWNAEPSAGSYNLYRAPVPLTGTARRGLAIPISA